MKILPIKSINAKHIPYIQVKNGKTSNITDYSNQNAKSNMPLNGSALLIYFGAAKSAEDKLEDFKIRELTDEEFKAKKAKIMSNKNKFGPFWNISEDMLTKYNVQLFEYMYEDCKGLTSDYPTHKDLEKENNLELYNEYMRLQCGHHCVPVETKEQAQVILKMMKMPWFFAADSDYAYALNNAGYNIKGKKSAEIKNVKLKMLDALEKNREKYEDCSSYQRKNICEMIADVTTYRGLNIARKMINNPELLDIDHLDIEVRNFFKRISANKEQAKIASEIIDKVVKKPELFEKEHFARALSIMLAFTNNTCQKDLGLAFLDNPALFEYEDFVLNMPGIICDFPSSEKAEDIETRKDVFETLDYYKKNPELLKNQQPYKDPDFVYALTHYCKYPGAIYYKDGSIGLPGLTLTLDF